MIHKQAELKELIEKFDSDCELNAIVHLLGISSAQVANLKKDVNKALFGEDTAKTIYKNLVSRYSFLSDFSRFNCFSPKSKKAVKKQFTNRNILYIK